MTNKECRILHSLESALMQLTREVKAIKQEEKLTINLDFHIDYIKADLNQAYRLYNEE